jgi:rubrerythrin
MTYNKSVLSEVNFGDPFSGLNNDRKLSHDELIRALRFSISAEFEAIQLYNQLADSITDNFVKKVLNDIADEEKVHVGELLKVIKKLDPEEEKFYTKGENEVEENFIRKLDGVILTEGRKKPRPRK